ncbi:MAG: mechanosensitive ion channel [Proteobacteria bacterium]|nr:mechanosensitive ion channel [Pseudomonadota bacterium]
MAEKNNTWPIFLFCMIIFIAAQANPAWCADPEPRPFNFEKTQVKIKEFSRQIKGGLISQQQFDNAKKQTEEFIQAANICIDTTTSQINRLEQETTSLGPVAEYDSAKTIKERKNLQKQQQALLVTLSECRLAATLATRLENEMAEHNKLLQAASFFSRSQNFFDRLAATLPTYATFTNQLSEYVLEQAGLRNLTLPMLLILTLLTAGGAFAGFKFYRLLQRRIFLYQGQQGAKQGLPALGLMALPVAMTTILAGGYLLYINQDTLPPVYGPWLCFSIGLHSLSLLLFRLRRHLQPAPPAALATAASYNCFNFLSFLAVILFFSTRLELTDFTALATLLLLSQSVVICMICVIGWWFLWPIKLPESLNRLEKSRQAGITMLSILVMIIELSGYRNFALFILIGILGTFLLSTLLRYSLFFIDLTISGFFTGKYHWQQGLRHKLGLSAQDNLTGMTWIRFIFKLLAWSIGFLLFLQLWGLPESGGKKIHGYLMDGFSLGGLVIAPARIIFGVFIFACGWTLVSWVKMQMEKRWLSEAGLSLSAEETLVTMTGYCGFALALIVGLSVTGFSFSNLAVIAGALSVGIGFGMQNIVNNFVSGLIILFERPVKRGDWIKIGDTEGYVQKISVRSTLIQTFDRSDVIVPNSELISNQVTNMMLNDNFGRLIVPVGVAYGSDTDLVRTILLEIAANNEEVINDGSAPTPIVLFLAFGESSLDFELRCHLAHIDKRLLVKSAINFEIDRAFREHKISIPFPQRDLYIKEFPIPPPMATTQNSVTDE